MLQLKNQTRLAASMAIFPNPDGVDTVYAVLKGTFEIRQEKAVLADEQRPIAPADTHWDDPAKSSLKQPAELGLTKPHTDVMVSGHAYPTERSERTADVELKIGPLQKSLRAFGNRFWERGLSGMRISEPEVFSKLPLRYEFAFGGVDLEPKNPASPESEPRNPLGKGFFGKETKATTAGVALPNIEDPGHLIVSPKDRPSPAGFGPVCAHWEPRRSYAGTYDSAWLQKRAPYLPLDFNPRFLQVAHPDLIANSYLVGGEPVHLTGLSEAGTLQFTLPRCTAEMTFHFDGVPTSKTANMDTICLEPDQRRFTCLWRASHVVDKKPHRLKEVTFNCKEFPI